MPVSMWAHCTFALPNNRSVEELDQMPRGRIRSVFGYDRAQLPNYVDLALTTVCGITLIWGLTILLEWPSGFDLALGLGSLGIAAACVVLARNKRAVLCAAFGFIAAQGTIGLSLRSLRGEFDLGSLKALGLILFSAASCYIVLRGWKK